MLSMLERNKEIFSLIEQEHYFVIHAARQTGKTTLAQELISYLEKEGKYYSLYCSLESVEVFRDAKAGIPEILNNIKLALKYSSLPNKNDFAKNIDKLSYSTQIGEALKDYCTLLDKPLVIFFDEIDSLQDETLVTFLRQLRDGFITRSKIPFLHSAVLIGMRNIRDYKSKVRDDRTTLGSASPFNIITDALTINNFSLEDIESLYRQHTEETGQIFARPVIEKIFEQTDGQPWLVNAIAREIVEKILKNDYTKQIAINTVEEAIQNIILHRDTHIDSLLDKLKEPRVQKVIESILLGKSGDINIMDDDTRYCLNLGLIKLENKEVIPGNKIYGEVIVRTLNYNTQFYLYNQIKNKWIDKEGNIDMEGLLKGFQQFWRENSDIWMEKYEYKEAAPHLILQAFLQRIINGGGEILREYASGRERMDLCVIYAGKKYVIELKIMYSKSVIKDGLEQISSYLSRIGENRGWLVIFDRSDKKNWDEKIYWQTENIGGKTIYVVGC